MPPKGIPLSKIHRKNVSKALKGRKFSKEHLKHIGIAQKKRFAENPVWNKGIKRTEEEKNKMSIGLRKRYSNGMQPWNKGVKRTDIIGNKNGRWKGGVMTLYLKIRGCFEMRQWRSDIFTRDNYICQECGDNRGGNLNAHHIIEFSDILEKYNVKTFEEALKCEELWNLNNGITLCELCHRKRHTKITSTTPVINNKKYVIKAIK